MRKFTVLSRVDAYVDYVAEVGADDADAAAMFDYYGDEIEETACGKG